MRFTRPASRGVVVGVSSLASLAIVGGIVVAVTHSSGGHDLGLGSHGSPPPSARLVVDHLKAGRVPYTQPLRLHVHNGAITQVNVRQADGKPVAGTFNARHTSWRSAHALGPLATLSGSVNYVDLDHRSQTAQVAAKTQDVPHHLQAVLSPGGGNTVGIGSPVVVSFNYPIPEDKRAAVERGLSVHASPSVVGAWHWMSPQSVHWRPPKYWKRGTTVTLGSDLQGIRVARGVWGVPGKHTTSFKIGDSHISEADVATDQMRVYDNGKLIRTLPFSAGREKYPTKNGVHITFEKSPKIIMDSATVGIPKGDPGYYKETVYWDVRISYGGAFVHAAPWSVASQGHANVSHGCINLSTANAQWFYNWARRGDIVDVYNSLAPVDRSDPGMADWNYTWKEWLAGDAHPSAAAKAIHTKLVPRQGEPGFAPPKKHQKKAAHHKH